MYICVDRKLINVSCEYDRLNGLNSALKTELYIGHGRLKGDTTILTRDRNEKMDWSRAQEKETPLCEEFSSRDGSTHQGQNLENRPTPTNNNYLEQNDYIRNLLPQRILEIDLHVAYVWRRRSICRGCRCCLYIEPFSLLNASSMCVLFPHL